MNRGQLTLGSLFDGIGGFPYAASFYGIRPLWASEIVPECVSVTKKHFPDMEHFGDITKLHGGPGDVRRRAEDSFLRLGKSLFPGQ